MLRAPWCTSVSRSTPLLTCAVTKRLAASRSIAADFPRISSSCTPHTTTRSWHSSAAGARSTLGLVARACGGVSTSSHISSFPCGASEAGDHR